MYRQADTCGADTCGTGGRNGNNLVYVGAGQGEFALEPQMKYVGYGGDYSVRRGFNVCLVLGPALACLLAILCYIFWPCEECLDRKEDYLYHWSPDKIMRCCARGFVPCPTTPSPPTFMPAPVGAVDPFNCAEDLANFQSGWSQDKKQWCFDVHGEGCDPRKPGCDAVQASSYDCAAGFANWVKGWSVQKKNWCCQNQKKGCIGSGDMNMAQAAGQGYGAGAQHGTTGAPVAAITGIVKHSDLAR